MTASFHVEQDIIAIGCIPPLGYRMCFSFSGHHQMSLGGWVSLPDVASRVMGIPQRWVFYTGWVSQRPMGNDHRSCF